MKLRKRNMLKLTNVKNDISITFLNANEFDAARKDEKLSMNCAGQDRPVALTFWEECQCRDRILATCVTEE
jgi:hypothetical protein